MLEKQIYNDLLNDFIKHFINYCNSTKNLDINVLNFKLIELKTKHMDNLLFYHIFTLRLENNLNKDQIGLIQSLITIFINHQINSHDFEMQSIDNDYLLSKIIDILGFNLPIKICLTNKLRKIFDIQLNKLMKLCENDIHDLLH